MKITEYIIALLRYKVCGADIDKEIFLNKDASFYEDLYIYSKKQDVSHIVGAALADLKLISSAGESGAKFSSDHMLAVFRYRRLTDELSRLHTLFEENEIAHIALKGSVLREFYPEPWMRTSCDIDILVNKKDLGLAKSLLTEKFGYEHTGSTPCDISFESKSGVHLELHFALMPDEHSDVGDALLDAVWERTYRAENKNFTYFMNDEIFYYYHIIHMAKHFQAGGCGVKPFLDLCILNERVPHDKSKREELLKNSRFSAFENGMLRLLGVWFSGDAEDEFTKSLESFIFVGGAYGTVENGVNVGVAQKKGRLKYVLSRIFLPYKSMRINYPILEKHKILLPLYHVRRWYRIVFKSGIKTAKSQIGKSGRITDEGIENMSSVLSKLGLLE